MPHQVTIKSELKNVTLPNLSLYQGGDIITLSDEDYSVIPSATRVATFSADFVVSSQPPPYIRRAYVTSGLITLPNTASAWQLVHQNTTGNPLLEIDVPAVAGETVSVAPAFLWQPVASSEFIDLCVIVGSSIVRYLGTGTSTPPFHGAPEYNPDITDFVHINTEKSFVVTSGDIDSGNVRIGVACNAAGSGVIYATTNFPFYWGIRNDRVAL